MAAKSRSCHQGHQARNVGGDRCPCPFPGILRWRMRHSGSIGDAADPAASSPERSAPAPPTWTGARPGTAPRARRPRDRAPGGRPRIARAALPARGPTDRRWTRARSPRCSPRARTRRRRSDRPPTPSVAPHTVPSALRSAAPSPPASPHRSGRTHTRHRGRGARRAAARGTRLRDRRRCGGVRSGPPAPPPRSIGPPPHARPRPRRIR